MKEEVDELLREFSALPKFSDGRIDYHSSSRALVLNCFVKFGDEILILKRSDEVLNYKSQWNSIGGFMDEDKPVHEKVFDELKEEIGVDKNVISKITVRDPWRLLDPSINKTWIIFPVLVELREKPEIKLDWEHTDYKWIKPDDITDYDIIYKLEDTMRRALG